MEATDIRKISVGKDFPDGAMQGGQVQRQTGLRHILS
jgi:hypothetical protein